MNFKQHFEDVRGIDNKEIYLKLINDGTYKSVSLKRLSKYEQIKPDVYLVAFLTDCGLVRTENSQKLYNLIDRLNADKDTIREGEHIKEILKIQPMGMVSTIYTVHYTPSKNQVELIDTEYLITPPKYTSHIWLDAVGRNGLPICTKVSIDKYLTVSQFNLFSSMTIRDTKKYATDMVINNLLEFTKASITRRH